VLGILQRKYEMCGKKNRKAQLWIRNSHGAADLQYMLGGTNKRGDILPSMVQIP
jgi:hypothetical protein